MSVANGDSNVPVVFVTVSYAMAWSLIMVVSFSAAWTTDAWFSLLSQHDRDTVMVL